MPEPVSLGREPTEYMEGYDAKLDGVPRIDNPYRPKTSEADSWDRGWDRTHAEEEA